MSLANNTTLTSPMDLAFNQVFTHHTAPINGFTMHYVAGGQGKLLLLLRGYPQTWYAWRHVMPELAKHYYVVAADLRGLGDSEKTLAGYDLDTLVEDIHQLVNHLGYATVCLVGHDWGAAVAHQFTVTHPVRVEKLVILKAICPVTSIGKTLLFDSTRPNRWWFPFQMVADLPEILVAGREETYLRWFYTNSAFNQNAIGENDIRKYVRCYAALGGMTAGFNYYRSLLPATNPPTREAATLLPMPVLALGGDHSLGMATLMSLSQLTTQVSGGILENCGHYPAEKQSAALLSKLLPFLAGKSGFS